jgi:hypothetical protein
MKKTIRFLLPAVLIVLCAAPVFAYEGDTPIKAQTPILITTAGQGPGGEFVDVLIKRNAISPSRLAATARDNYLQDQKTLIVALSSSLKGMGAAGISITQELERLNGLISQAKGKGMTVIGCHIEGQARRGGYDEDIINQLAPKMDYLIVRNDGNTDGIFNRIAQRGKIPITYIEKISELGQIFTEMFK